MWKIFSKKSGQDNQDDKAKKEVPTKPIEKKEILAAVKKEPEISPEVAKTKTSSQAHAIFLRPLVSEKNSIASSQNRYAFAVRSGANKIEVAKAFRALYNVKPLSVRLMIMPEKQKRYNRISGVRPEWKKAIIRVPAGSKVDIYAGV